MTVGTTAPTTPKLGQEWFDTTNKVLMVCTQADPSVVWTPGGLSYPRLVGNKSIDHHFYGTTGWDESTVVITNVQTFVPAGHLYKLEADLRLNLFHGGVANLKTHFTGTALYGNASAIGELLSLVDTSVSTPGYSRSITGISAAGNITLHILSKAPGASNGDRQAFGEVLLWDLGPDADIPTLS
jgi:hypothetical protein